MAAAGIVAIVDVVTLLSKPSILDGAIILTRIVILTVLIFNPCPCKLQNEPSPNSSPALFLPPYPPSILANVIQTLGGFPIINRTFSGCS
jgi:hypothetical protein